MSLPYGFHSTEGREVSGSVFDYKKEVSSSSVKHSLGDAGEGREAGTSDKYCNSAGVSLSVLQRKSFRSRVERWYWQEKFFLNVVTLGF